jgi:hypothetical protein
MIKNILILPLNKIIHFLPAMNKEVLHKSEHMKNTLKLTSESNLAKSFYSPMMEVIIKPFLILSMEVKELFWKNKYI